MLVEKNGWLGGLGMWGTGLHSFFNIFAATPGAQRMRVVAGIAQELVDRTQAAGGGIGHVHMTRGGDFVSMITPVDPEVFRLAAARVCLEAGVKLLFETVVYEVQASGGEVTGVRIWNKGGKSTIRAKLYIDCSGDGDVAAYAGAPFTHFKAGDPGAYSAGYTFRLVNVDLAALEADLEKRGLIAQLAHAVKPEIDRHRRHPTSRPARQRDTSWQPSERATHQIRPQAYRLRIRRRHSPGPSRPCSASAGPCWRSPCRTSSCTRGCRRRGCVPGQTPRGPRRG